VNCPASPSEALGAQYKMILHCRGASHSTPFFVRLFHPRANSDSSLVMKLTLLPLIVLLVLAGGCASGPKTNIEGIDWKSRIGTYTYDEAMAELGQPNVIGESSEGRTAEWVLRQSPAVTFGFGLGSGSSGGHTATGVGVGTTVSPPPSGEYLRLRFDKEDKLAEWSRVKY
jgi:hypothetical protein